MARSTAYQILDAAKVVGNLSAIADIPLPVAEAHARPLTQLEPKQQLEAWQTAVETAPDGKITAAHVQAVVDSVKDRVPFVSHNTGKIEWYTPASIIEAARATMGSIDADPASSAKANNKIHDVAFLTLSGWNNYIRQDAVYYAILSL